MKHTAIDIHTHVEFADTAAILKKKYTEEEIFSRFVVPATGTRSAQNNRGLMPALRDPLRDPQRKIRDMDERKLAFSVLSSTPFAFFYEIEENLAVELARSQNDQLAAMVKQYPDSFAAMATLPLQVPGEALKELDRAIHTLGLRESRSGPMWEAGKSGTTPSGPSMRFLKKKDCPCSSILIMSRGWTASRNSI